MNNLAISACAFTMVFWVFQFIKRDKTKRPTFHQQDINQYLEQAAAIVFSDKKNQDVLIVGNGILQKEQIGQEWSMVHCRPHNIEDITVNAWDGSGQEWQAEWKPVKK